MNIHAGSITGRNDNTPASTVDGGNSYCCLKLPFVPAADLGAVRQVFRQAMPLSLRQSWLAKEEPGFSPAVVYAGWSGQSLLVFAEFADVDIFTRATVKNQPLWELGDVFEIFLCPIQQSSYVELQIAPNNQWLQLRYPDTSSAKLVHQSTDIKPYLILDKVFNSAVWSQPQVRKWFVYAEIPSGTICEKQGSLAGNQWLFSFSRYDYTRDRVEPVISSTSPHAQPDFHCRQEWGTMQFCRVK